ncbi:MULTISPECIES: amidohydrolase family protein [unclassified Brevibacterium]|uniref:amidohydrolase family protein n=1 Tax=unclassified Brevibacterium TaxID=2614124 RepID=UPI001092E935|nr:amidohydrolase family protein [Brevibacterium sp. S22]TGD29140.1 hypothetical protein EB835_16530 [Brevibacterium sp. S22]
MLIRRAHMVVGDGAEIPQADLRIHDGQIVEISTDGLAPAGEEVIEATGRTVIPGLIDAHMHFDYLGVHNGLKARVRTHHHKAMLLDLLRNGITMVRTMADPLREVTRLKRFQSTSRPGPHLVIAGPALTAPGGHPEITVARDNRWLQKHMVRAVDGPTEARTVVRSLAASGVDLIKIVVQGGDYAEFGDSLNKLSWDSVRAVIDEAHTRGLTVSAHTHYQDDVDALLDLGIDSIEHGVIEDPVDDADGFLHRWAQSGVPLVSTLVIEQAIRNDAGDDYLSIGSENLRRAHEAGVPIVAGTDSMAGAMPAGSLHDELQLLVSAGLSPTAALQAATGRAAELLGLRDRGIIAEGKTADLLVLDSKPLDDISSTTDITMVIQDGRIVHRPRPRETVRLADFAPSETRPLEYSDSTGDAALTVTVDSARFSVDGTRTLIGSDPNTGKLVRSETLTSESNLATIEWSCRIPDEDTELAARRDGQQIELTGVFAGKQVNRTYSLRHDVWLQGIFFDAATFMTGEGETLTFVAIGTSGRGALQATRFELSKGEKEGVATLVIPRWRRWWSAQVETDPTDGSLLLAKSGPGKEIRRLRHGTGGQR